MQMASMLASSIWISGKSFATFFASSRKRPSVARTTFALWTIVTFLRPCFRANSKAARTIRSEPFFVLILQEMAYSSPARFREVREGLRERCQRRRELGRHRVELDAGVEVLGVLAEDHEVDPLLVVQRIARVGLAGPQADVEVEQLRACGRWASGRRAPCPSAPGTSSASAAFTGFDVIAPNRAASTFFRSSMVRAGNASPSVHQNSQPMSPWMYSASSSTASRTSRAASITSMPMPSPAARRCGTCS